MEQHIGSGRWSERHGTRLEPLRRIGLVLTAGTAAVAALVEAPLGILVPALVVAGVLSISWNALSFTAAAEAAGAARRGAAPGFPPTLLRAPSPGVPPP